MNYISKLDELGFIPKKRETEEKFITRAETWLSLEDRIEGWAKEKGYTVLDNTKPVEVIYRHMKTKPAWVPLLEKKMLICRGKCRGKKICDVKVPVAFVNRKENESLHNMVRYIKDIDKEITVDKRTDLIPMLEISVRTVRNKILKTNHVKAHEVIHAVMEQINGNSGLVSRLFHFRNIVAEEVIAAYPEFEETGYNYASSLGMLKFFGPALIGAGTGFLAFELVAGSLPISGPLWLYMGVQFVRGRRLVSKLEDALPGLKREFPDKLGYLMLRVKPSELLEISKDKGCISKIKGLRGEIIRKHL